MRNDITLMSCQHSALSPRCSIDSRGICLSCGEQPEADDMHCNTGSFVATSLVPILSIADAQRGVIYK